MKRYLNAPVLGLTVLMTIALIVLMIGQSADTFDIVVGAGLFLVLNYVFLTLLLRALRAIFRVLRLPGVKLKSYAYYLYPLALLLLYVPFLLVNVRLTGYQLPVMLIAGLAIAGIAGLILAQLGGTFPHKKVTQKKLGYRLDAAGGSPGGVELLGSLYGEYQDGIVLGVDHLEYSALERIRRSKDVIVVEGPGLPAPEIILVTDKAKQYFTGLLAERLGASREHLLALAEAKSEGKRSGIFRHKKEDSRAKDKGVRRSKPVKLVEAQRQEKARSKNTAGRK